jgi:hypothetical protein
MTVGSHPTSMRSPLLTLRSLLLVSRRTSAVALGTMTFGDGRNNAR